MFQYKTYLPVSEKEIYSTQLSYRDYFTLIKTIQNGDDDKIEEAFIRTIVNCTGDPSICTTLTNIDKLALLLNIRIMSVSDQLELTLAGKEEGSRNNVKMDLYDTLDKITNNDFVYTTKVKLAKGISAVLVIPDELRVDQSQGVVYDSISTLHVGSESFKFEEMGDDQQRKLLDALPASAGQSLKRGISKLNEFSVDVITDVSDPLKRSLLTIRLFDTSIFETLKLIYNSSLQDQYTLRYILTKRCNMSCEYLDTLPPTDVNTYYTLYKKEIEEEKKAHEAATRSSNSVSLPLTPPSS